MVIDDHPIVVLALRSLCDQNPTLLEYVGGAIEAGEKARSLTLLLKPDVLIVDVQLPNDIFDTVEKIKASCPTMAIIFVTDFATTQNTERAIAAGASAILAKNDNQTDILDTILKVAGGHLVLKRTPKTRRVKLSKREIQILKFVAGGYTSRKMGEMLQISHRTVERHIDNIGAKLHLNNKVELTRYAIREGLVDAAKFEIPTDEK